MKSILNMPGTSRLEKIEHLFTRKKRNNNQLCWIKFNPDSDYSYDIENAEEDIQWMVYEIKRLKKENKELKGFVDALRLQLEEELGIGKGP